MNPISREDLIRAKRLALRLKVWYKLERASRSIVDLSIGVIKLQVKSRTLNEMLRKILLKIMEHTFSWRAKKIGLELALRQVGVALSWGLEGALKWLQDEAYVIFLGVNHINNPGAYKP